MAIVERLGVAAGRVIIAGVTAPDPRQELFDCLEAAVAGGVFPGCVALVGSGGADLYHEAHGAMATHEAAAESLRAVGRDTVYDLASLTKVLATTTLAAIAVAEGRVALGAPVPDEWARGCPGACLADLLAHCAGLPAHREFFVDLAGARPYRAAPLVARIAATDPEYPLRARAVYSDLGFVLVGAWLERIFDDGLDRLFADRVAWPLGLDRRPLPRIGFQPITPARGASAEALRIVAPTEVYDPALHPDGVPSYFPLRRPQGVAQSEVHDDNALVMGGVAGHAGLFGDAEAVATIARAWLTCEIPGLDPRTRDRFWTASTVPGSTRRLGWDGVGAEGSSTGGALSSAAVGHLGFTGTSVWIDPAAAPARVYVLLSNRVHPTRTHAAIVALRPTFHRIASRL